jgi:hypothetical protein
MLLERTLGSTGKERTGMRNSHRVFLTAFPGFILVLQAMCAFASGREGEALVKPVLWIVTIVAGGPRADVVRGAIEARRLEAREAAGVGLRGGGDAL